MSKDFFSIFQSIVEKSKELEIIKVKKKNWQRLERAARRANLIPEKAELNAIHYSGYTLESKIKSKDNFVLDIKEEK